MKWRSILLILLLTLGLAAAYGWHTVTNYQPTIATGPASVGMQVKEFTAGPVVLADVMVTAQLAAHFSYPEDWQALLRQKVQRITARQATLPYEGGQADLQGLTLDFIPGEDTTRWRGKWKVKQITLQQSPYPLPALSGGGNFAADEKNISLTGRVQDATDTHNLAFAAHYPVDAPKEARITLTSGQAPFEGGVVRLKEGKVHLQGKEVFSGVLQADNIPLSTLLNTLMEGKVEASGNVSGSVPVTLRADGSPVIADAVLAAASGGTLRLQPGALPGRNPQLALVSDVLENFHYTALSIQLRSDEKDELAVTLKLEGNNPDQYEGRTIKLNVHLTGDLLSLIKHSVLTLSDPKTLLKKGRE